MRRGREFLRRNLPKADEEARNSWQSDVEVNYFFKTKNTPLVGVFFVCMKIKRPPSREAKGAREPWEVRGVERGGDPCGRLASGQHFWLPVDRV